MKLNPDKSTIISFDAKNIYFSIKYALIDKSVYYFSATLSICERTTIKLYLKMIKLALTSNILTFRGKYYKYNGAVEINKRGLAIGYFESAWLTDLAMLFILEQSIVKEHFDDTLLKGIYRDDGQAIFDKKEKKKDVATWLDSFQKAIDFYATNDFLKFTVTIWGADRDDRSRHLKVAIDTNNLSHS